MSAVVLDGKLLARQVEAELAVRVQRLKGEAGGKPPVLATILVGDDPASATYVRLKASSLWLWAEAQFWASRWR